MRSRAATWTGLLVVIVFSSWAIACPPGDDVPPTRQTVNLVTLDFTARDGNYDLNWPGPPRRAPRWSDVEFYDPVLSLDHAPFISGLRLCFSIREDRRLWFDIQLGTFCAFWDEGNLQPDHFAYASQGDASGVPTGAPSSIDHGFWLVCTKKGKVKGNDGHGDDGHANVYLEKHDMVTAPPGLDVGEQVFQSARHVVRCR